MTQKAQSLEDGALGCLYGTLVGDAAGATLEFLGHKPTPAEVKQAMTMPGGGMLNVAPGQITDDGELTLCLAQALAASPTFNVETIAQHYARWIESNPFDIGITTQSSLGSYGTTKDKKGYALVMTQAAQRHCLGSKANGSLMRITPLGIWGHRLEDRQLATFAQQDSALSHPNPSCCYAVGCYVIAISSLMKQRGDGQAAFIRAKNWLDAQSPSNLLEQRGLEEVQGWLQDAENHVNVPYHPQIGFIKIAFTHGFRHLWLGSDYLTALEETLLGGGDTDTNACIVGGLIGAVWGAHTIPESMKKAVLNCDTNQGRSRPSFLHPRQVPELLEKMLRIVES